MWSAQVDSKDATPTGSVHQSRDNIVVCAIEQVFLFCIGDNTVKCIFASTLCNYGLSKGDLFVLSCGRMRRVCLGSVFEMVVCTIEYFFSFFEVICDYGGVYCCEVGVYVVFCNGVWMCANVCRAIYSGLYLESVSGFMYCLCRWCDGCCAFHMVSSCILDQH